jgi:hypothetical protein
MTSVTKAGEPCACGCACCAAEAKAPEQEIAELRALKESIDRRLAQLVS